jgi:shikimate kinase
MTLDVVLVGLPGAGKSTTGRRLARILDVPFADTDDLVERDAGQLVTEIFARAGEPAFRAAEHAVVARALREADGVLSLGGGALTNPDTVTVLHESSVPVVHLRAKLDTLGLRVGDARTRPLLAEDPAARLAVLAAERSAAYDSVATFVVDTDGRTPGQVAATIAARLHDRKARR